MAHRHRINPAVRRGCRFDEYGPFDFLQNMRSTSSERRAGNFWGPGAVEWPSPINAPRRSKQQEKARKALGRSGIKRAGEAVHHLASSHHNEHRREFVMATQSYRERMKAARAQASAQRKAEKAEYRR